MINGSLTVLSIGKVDDEELKTLGSYGAQKILSIDNENLKVFDSQAYASVIAEIATRRRLSL